MRTDFRKTRQLAKPPPRKLQSRPWTTTRPTTRETTIAWRFPRRMERDAATTNPTRRNTPVRVRARRDDEQGDRYATWDVVVVRFFSRRKLGVADERRVRRDVSAAEQQEHHRVVAVVVSWMYLLLDLRLVKTLRIVIGNKKTHRRQIQRGHTPRHRLSFRRPCLPRRTQG